MSIEATLARHAIRAPAAGAQAEFSARRRENPRNRGYGPCRADRRASRHRPAGGNGRRCETASSTSRRGASSATATMSARGTITSATLMSCSASTFLSMARSCGRELRASTLVERVLDVVAHRGRRKTRAARASARPGRAGCSRGFDAGSHGLRSATCSSASVAHLVIDSVRIRIGDAERARESAAPAPPCARLRHPSRDRSRSDAEIHATIMCDMVVQESCPVLPPRAPPSRRPARYRRASANCASPQRRLRKDSTLVGLSDAAPSRVEPANRASSRQAQADLAYRRRASTPALGQRRPQ